VSFSLQLHQASRERLSAENETVAHLKDDLTVANRRRSTAEDELVNCKTIMHGLDSDLLAKTISLDQALRVGGLAIFLFILHN